MADKLPYMKFFPADYLSEETLRGRTLAARGLWMEMICIMWKSSKRGFLLNKAGTPIDPSQLAIMAGAGAKEVARCLQELERAETFSRDKDGVIYCRRMVDKAQLSEVRSVCGAMGGRPKKQKESKPEANQKVGLTMTMTSDSGSGLFQKQEDATPKDSAPTPRPGSMPPEPTQAELDAEADAAFGGDGRVKPHPTALYAAVEAYCDAKGIPAGPTRRYRIHQVAEELAQPDSCDLPATLAGLEWGRATKASWTRVQSHIRNTEIKAGWVEYERPKSANGKQDAFTSAGKASQRRAENARREFDEQYKPLPEL